MTTEAPNKQTDAEENTEPRFGKHDYTPDFKPTEDKSLTDDQLSQKEKSGAKPNSSDNSPEKEGLFSGEEKPSRLSKVFKKVTARKRYKYGVPIGLGIAGVGMFGFFAILQGPAQAIQLLAALDKANLTNKQTMGFHMKGMYRYIKTGDPGETQVGKLGSVMANKVITDLKNQGITYDRTANGLVTKSTINPRENSALKNLSHDERVSLIARDLGVDASNITTLGSGTFTVDLTSVGISTVRGFLFNSMRLAGMSERAIATNGRQAARFFRLPSLFHPIKKAEAILDSKLPNTKAAIDEKRNKLGQMVEPSPEVKARLDKVKGGLGSSTSAASSLAIADVYCATKDAVEAVPVLTYGLTIAPAIIGSYVAMSHGSQTQSGDDITIKQLGNWVGTFTDKDGKSIWQAKSLNALSGKNRGIDLDNNIKQAFSPRSSTSGLQKDLNSVQGGDFACSKIGVGLQIFVGSVLAVASGGTSFLIKNTISGAAKGVIFSRIIGYIQHLVAGPDVAKLVFGGGPLGGNLLAHGSMAAAAMTGRSMGGTEHSRTASNQLRQENLAYYQEEFSEKSFSEKIFSRNNPSSLVVSIAQSLTVDSLNPTSMISSLPFGVGSKIFAAEEEPYDWPMPEYTMKRELFTDPKYANLYENADEVAKFIAGSPYIERVKACFGVSIENDGSGWAVLPLTDTNPAVAGYEEANCGENDERWNRVTKFVGDSRAMASWACNEGPSDVAEIQKACTNSGIGTTQTQTATTPATTTQPGDGQTPIGNLTESSVDIACATGTKDLGAHDGYTAGSKVQIRLCAIENVSETGDLSDVPGAGGKLVVNSRVSGAIVKMVADAASAGINPITAAEGFRSMARQTHLFNCKPGCGIGDNPVATPGTSNHQLGIAIDWNQPMNNWLRTNSEKYGYKWYGPGDAPHFSPTGR